ncbi:hypothetical protein [Lewinella cohaerens]|uniref:hypothetical protein n=1 Tax=Lewinella cohaerens TaxID=70995 RepID=UPI0003796651|nr:hypothetical protein [Lewinella cohaerens]
MADQENFFLANINPICLGVILLVGILVLIFSKSRRILNSLPGFSTSIGVLGTFLVLYFYLSSEDLNLEKIKDVNALVQNLAAAFSTSIIGIIGSVIFSFLVKGKLDWLEKQNNWDQHPAALLKDLIEKTSSNQEHILTLAKSVDSLTSNLVSDLATVFEKVEKNIGQTLIALNNQAKDMYSEEMKNTTQEMLAGYSQKVDDTSKELIIHLQNKTKLLEQSFASLESMQGRAATMLEESSSSFRGAVEQYQALQETATSVIGEVDQKKQRFDELVNNVESLLETINKRSEGIIAMQQQLTDIGNVVDQLDRLKQELRKVNQNGL